jgi:cytochrome P450
MPGALPLLGHVRPLLRAYVVNKPELARLVLDHGDALSLIMSAHGGPADQALTDTEVADQIRTVLAGSIETEASLLSWICHALGLGHPAPPGRQDHAVPLRAGHASGAT